MGCRTYCLRERPGERLLPWLAGKASDVATNLQMDGWRDIGRSLGQVLLLPASLLGALAFFIFRLAYGFNLAALPVLTVQDLGWADTTLYGHTQFYQTPNVERLAKRGMTFTHAYSASQLCSPTRATGLSAVMGS